MTSARNRNVASIAMLTLVSVLLLGASAGAAPLQVGCEEIPACADGFTMARKLAQNGQPEDAIKAFLTLYNNYSDPRLCFAIAEMMYQTGRYSDAAEYYRRLLLSGVESDPEKIALIKSRLAQAESHTQVSVSAPAAEQPRTTTAQQGRPPEPGIAKDVGPSEESRGTGSKLSAERKLTAAILGGLAGAALITSIALTVTDKQYTALPCTAMNPEGKCRLDNLGLYVTGYALAGALSIGFGITLLWPSRPVRAKTQESH